jgi:hypothetical protein
MVIVVSSGPIRLSRKSHEPFEAVALATRDMGFASRDRERSCCNAALPASHRTGTRRAGGPSTAATGRGAFAGMADAAHRE